MGCTSVQSHGAGLRAGHENSESLETFGEVVGYEEGVNVLLERKRC